MAALAALSACDSSENDPIIAERGLPGAENGAAAGSGPISANERAKLRYARYALSCVNQQYPNEITHLLNSEEDAVSPKNLHPAFYGCFRWSAAVHNHWLLVHLWGAGEVPELDGEIEAVLSSSFTQKNIDAERRYFMGEERDSFERPYGMAWFLHLMAELRNIAGGSADNSKNNGARDDAGEDSIKIKAKRMKAQAIAEELAPLETIIVEELKDWLMKLRYPVRGGNQNQSAFAMALILDWAQNGGDKGLEKLVRDKAMQFYAADRNCPIAYEPSGQDLLSPCLMQADLMRRILPAQRFSAWLDEFLPDIPTDGQNGWIRVAAVQDASDKKLGQLNGLNLSRAWALQGIASALDAQDTRRSGLLRAARQHRKAGLASVDSEFYASTHWLPSFATYLASRRSMLEKSENANDKGAAAAP